MAFELSARSIGLRLAAALATGWIGASVMQDTPPAQSSRPTAASPLGTPAPVLRAEVLRERLKEPPLPSRGRNPFMFGARAPRSSAASRDRAATPIDLPPMAAPYMAPMPVFTLSGIASTAEGGATVLTAILSDNGTMVFAKAGDKLSNGYSVVRVEETLVTLVDATGVTQTIRLP